MKTAASAASSRVSALRSAVPARKDERRSREVDSPTPPQPHAFDAFSRKANHSSTESDNSLVRGRSRNEPGGFCITPRKGSIRAAVRIRVKTSATTHVRERLHAVVCQKHQADAFANRGSAHETDPNDQRIGPTGTESFGQAPSSSVTPIAL
jgi:hypothetical protein